MYRQSAKSPPCIDSRRNSHHVLTIGEIPAMYRQSAESPLCINNQRNPHHVLIISGISTVYRQTSESPPCIDSRRNSHHVSTVIGIPAMKRQTSKSPRYSCDWATARTCAIPRPALAGSRRRGGIRRRQRRPDCLTSALPPTDMSTYNSKAGQAVRTCPVLYYRGICLMNCHHPDGSFSLRYEANRGQLAVSGITG